MIEGNKKYKLIIGALLICLTISLGINILNKDGFRQYKKEQEAYENKADEMIIWDLLTEGEDYDNAVKEYKDNIDTYKTAIEQKDKNKCEEISSQLLKASNNLVALNNEILNYKLEEIKNEQNARNTYEYENIIIDKNKSEIKSLKDEEKYNSAYKKYVTTINDIGKISDSLLKITQYDFSEFPKVKVYLDGYDLEKIINSSIDKTRFKIVEKIGDEYKKVNIKKQGAIREEGNLNLDIVADVSASMDSYLGEVKLATKSLADNMDMNKNKLGLLTFSDYATRQSNFTNDKGYLYNQIDNLYTENMTSLYDSLCESIIYTSQQNGAKCIVAFTDGLDNKSIYGYEDVINLAIKYEIPIYIIGIGIYDSSYEQILNNISSSTGGYYTNIDNNNISYEMQNIYNDISKKQKSLYYIEYEDKIKDKSEKRDLFIEYNAGNTIVRNNLKETITEHDKSSDDIGKKAQVASFIKECNYKYFEALNKRDVNLVKDYYSQSDTGKQLVNEIKSHIKYDEKNNNYYEYCDYNIEKITKEDDHTYKVTFSQSFTQISDNHIKSWTNASAVDTVIEINGRFYMDGYKSLSNGTSTTEEISNNLTE